MSDELFSTLYSLVLKQMMTLLFVLVMINHFSTMTPLVLPEGFSAQYHDAPGTGWSKNALKVLVGT